MPAPTVQTGVATSTDHNNLAQYVDDVRTGILARGRRTTTSTTTTTIVGVLRLDDVPLIGGHVHKIWSSGLAMATTVSGDSIRVDIRYTTDGSTPTTGSAVLPGSAIQGKVNASTIVESAVILTTYTPTSDETFSGLLCVSRVGGTGSVSIFGDTSFSIDVVVEDYGIDSGDVGVDI